jgi:hypothetical protein
MVALVTTPQSLPFSTTVLRGAMFLGKYEKMGLPSFCVTESQGLVDVSIYYDVYSTLVMLPNMLTIVSILCRVYFFGTGFKSRAIYTQVSFQMPK